MKNALMTGPRWFSSVCLLVVLTGALTGCETTSGSVRGNEGGSEPLSDQEALEYQKAVTRCHKTGGSRIVKIKGELRCY